MTASDTPLARVFAFDPDFLATRAPAVLLYWVVGIVVLVVVIIEGRWRELTRGLEMGAETCVLRHACVDRFRWAGVCLRGDQSPGGGALSS